MSCDEHRRRAQVGLEDDQHRRDAAEPERARVFIAATKGMAARGRFESAIHIEREAGLCGVFWIRAKDGGDVVPASIAQWRGADEPAVARLQSQRARRALVPQVVRLLTPSALTAASLRPLPTSAFLHCLRFHFFAAIHRKAAHHTQTDQSHSINLFDFIPLSFQGSIRKVCLVA